MAKIERVEILQVNLPPKVVRTDAIQSFVKQETPIVRITCNDGAQGTGYTYTIGTGGSSVVALIADHLGPRLIGRDADAWAFPDPRKRYAMADDPPARNIALLIDADNASPATLDPVLTVLALP